MDFLSVIIFVLALGGMIFVHELGHFLAARWAGIEVEEFGFGLPSYRLLTLFTWKGTAFTIHALPLGGFVRPKGENDPNVPGGLAAASPWKRLVVLFAGPLMNLLTAVIVFSLLIAMQGVEVPGTIKINAVSEASPAIIAGVERGDILLAIDGQPVGEVDAAIELIRANLDQPVELLIERDGEQFILMATPLSTRKREEGALGVELSYPTRPATLTEIATGGFAITGLQAANLVLIPVAIVQGVIAPEDARLVGLKGMFDMFDVGLQTDIESRQEVPDNAGNTAAPQPTNWTLSLIGLLSVSLGIMNLLPIPALDGGRILFTLPEIFLHKRVPTEWENMVNGVAMLVLIVLMLYVNAMDFINPVQIPTR